MTIKAPPIPARTGRALKWARVKTTRHIKGNLPLYLQPLFVKTRIFLGPMRRHGRSEPRNAAWHLLRMTCLCIARHKRRPKRMTPASRGARRGPEPATSAPAYSPRKLGRIMFSEKTRPNHVHQPPGQAHFSGCPTENLLSPNSLRSREKPLAFSIWADSGGGHDSRWLH